MLTPKQREALLWIDKYQRRHDGVSPSYRELMMGMGFASISSVSKILGQLIDRGYIRKIFKRVRSIEILKRPGQVEYHVWDLGEHRLVPLDEHRKRKAG
jgi:SOS-response transcriptional repressor LexA